MFEKLFLSNVDRQRKFVLFLRRFPNFTDFNVTADIAAISTRMSSFNCAKFCGSLTQTFCLLNRPQRKKSEAVKSGGQWKSLEANENLHFSILFDHRKSIITRKYI